MTYYLDSSAILPVFKQEAKSSAVIQWMNAAAPAFAISQLVRGEVFASFAREERMKFWDGLQTAQLVRDFTEWSDANTELIPIHDEDVKWAAQSVVSPLPKFLMPDAIHVAICNRLGLTLVTLDQDLLLIAIREGVNAISPA